MTIDLNCDMGEGIMVRTSSGLVSVDSFIMPFISSANIACGAHAGSSRIIADTLALAREHGTAVGAHPGYPDRVHFGRLDIDMPQKELAHSLKTQIANVREPALQMGLRLRHVKPHGALYNMAAKKIALAELIADVVYDIDPELILVGPPASALAQAAAARGLRFAAEAFVDRAYTDDGTLLPRNQPGAVIQNWEEMTARAIMIIVEKKLITVSGSVLPVVANTLCIHGDNPGAPECVKLMYSKLTQAGIEVKAFTAESLERKID